MTDALKSLPSAPYHFVIFFAVVWRLWYILPLSSFLVASCALVWLVARLDTVLAQPVDDLIRTLGLEVPTAPIVSLLDISCNSISIHWKALEKKAEIRYAILVNGINVGDVSPSESSVTVKGLAPGVCYTLRVVAINNQNFQAASDSLRAQTSRSGSSDENAQSRKTPTAPAVMPYKGPHEGLVPPIAPAGPAKEHRHSLSQKQPSGHRRSSPNPVVDQFEDDPKNASSEKTRHAVQQLQHRLNELKQETDELHQQDEEDERQFHSERQSLGERRDLLRQELKDKEDESKELKKAVNQLERKNVAIQQRKSNQERALESKRHERRKLKDDMARWEREVVRFKEMMQSMAEQKEKFEQETEEMLDQARSEREPGLQSMKALEEQIQHTGRHVKELEDTRSGSGPSSPTTEFDQKRFDEDRDFNDKLTNMRMTMQRLWLECDTSRKTINQMQARAGSMAMPRRDSQAGIYDPHVHGDPFASDPELSNTSHRMPPRSMGALPSIPFSTAGEFESRGMFGAVSSQRAPLLHTNSSHSDGFNHNSFSQAEIDRLTGGALASPSANALLPSDLLGDDIDDLNRRHLHKLSHQGSDGLGSRPSSTIQHAQNSNMSRWQEPSFLPGLGNVPNSHSNAAVNFANPPVSPTYHESRSPSLTSSPHESISAFHQQRLSEGHMDSDRRSIRSTSSSSRMAPGRSRFLGDVFSRQRGKTDADEGPALGSLKNGQTRSLPRAYDPDNAEMSPEQKRVSSGSFLGTMSHGLLGRRAQTQRLAEDTGEPVPRMPPRANAFSRLGSRVNPWAAGAVDPSSRPTSVYSTENIFPHPLSSDAPFGWSMNGSGSLAGPGIGLDRSNTTSSNRVRSPWSPYASRRGSLQVDQSGNNDSLAELGHYENDADALPLHSQAEKPAQAPIGTKPSRFMSSMKKSPSANRARSPADATTAKEGSFKHMFGGSKRGQRSSSKPSGKKSKEPSVDGDRDRDTRRPSTDLASLSATTASTDPDADDAPPPSSAPATPSTSHTSEPRDRDRDRDRESLMRKLTRKSSYIPGLMSRRGTTAPSTPAVGAPDSDDESAGASHLTPSSAGAAAAAGTGATLARTPSSLASSPKPSYDGDRDRDDRARTSEDRRAKRSSGFSLRGLRRRRDRDGEKEKEREKADAPSVSGASLTSEATGDEDARSRGSLSVDEV